MSCTNARGHRWLDRIPDLPATRRRFGDRIGNINRLLAADPARRICVQCGARGRVDGQGRVEVVIGPDGRPLDQNPKVRVVPLAQRAKWAQQKTEYD